MSMSVLGNVLYIGIRTENWEWEWDVDWLEGRAGSVVEFLIWE